MNNNDELNSEFKNNTFKVPDGYFEKLNNGITSQLYSSKSKLTFWKKNSKWLVAASILLVVSVGIFINSNKTEIPISYASITADEYTAFEENNELTDDELIDIVSTEAIDSLYQNEIKTISYFEEEEINSSDTLTEYSLFEDEIQI